MASTRIHLMLMLRQPETQNKEGRAALNHALVGTKKIIAHTYK